MTTYSVRNKKKAAYLEKDVKDLKSRDAGFFLK